MIDEDLEIGQVRPKTGMDQRIDLSSGYFCKLADQNG